MNWFIVKLCHEDLEVTSLSLLFYKLKFNDIKVHSMQEPLICKWYDYICARDHAFRTKQITQMKDGQVVHYNNSAYLLTEADNTHEAVDQFWILLHEQSYKQLMDDDKEDKIDAVERKTKEIRYFDRRAPIYYEKRCT